MSDNSAEESRTTLVAALTAAGLNVQWAVGERAAAPLVLVEPGDPWIERHSVGGMTHLIHWRIVVVAAKDEQNVAVHDLSEGALISERVLKDLASWSTSDISGYRSIPDNPAYIAVELSTSTHIQVVE